jgi:hypothetical protein
MMLMRKCALLLTVAGLCMAADTPKSWTGVVGDDMCSGDHKAMGGTDPAKCTAECVKEMNAKYALIVGKDAYILSDQKAPAKYVGKKVKVTGTLNGKELTVQSITPAR